MKKTLLLSFLVLAGCARDPAKDAPAAKVSTPEATATPDVVPTAEISDPAKTPAAAKGETLPIDSAASKLEWKGSKVTGAHDGGFKTFTGSITLVDGKPEASRVRVEIDTASLWTDSEKLAGHLRSKDFFEVEKFPKATFESTSITPGAPGVEGATHTVKGNLTLHGVTKQISFPATIAVGEKEVTAKARFALSRKEFGIVYTGAADDLIRDDVLIKWDIVAKRGSA